MSSVLFVSIFITLLNEIEIKKPIMFSPRAWLSMINSWGACSRFVHGSFEFEERRTVVFVNRSMVRKLRGGTKKENKHEKKERRVNNAKARQQVLTIVVPALIALALLVAGYVYLATRQKRQIQ